MKNLILLAVIFTTIASAQSYKVFAFDTLRNSELDTSAVIRDVPTFKQISGYFASNDSTNGILFIEYKMNDNYIKWAVASAETITVASSTGAAYGTVIRSHWNDKVPGAQILRFRFQTLASGNNTQSAVKRYSFDISIEK